MVLGVDQRSQEGVLHHKRIRGRQGLVISWGVGIILDAWSQGLPLHLDRAERATSCRKIGYLFSIPSGTCCELS